MPRGGHAKSGPIGKTAAQRQAQGLEVRARHRTKGKAGTVAEAVEQVPPPPHLTSSELEMWAYYAPIIHEAGRLTRECRDCLAKYCTALAIVKRLKAQTEAEGYSDFLLTIAVDGDGTTIPGAKPHPVLVQLRQWIMTCRAYEMDLLLSPAAAVRAPGKPAEEEDGKPKGPGAKVHDFYGVGAKRGPRPVS